MPTILVFFKQKTAYEVRMSDWSSDVCSSDLAAGLPGDRVDNRGLPSRAGPAGGSRIRLHLHGRIRHHRSSPVVLFAAVGRGIHEDTDCDDARKKRLIGDRMKGRAAEAISGEIAEREPDDDPAQHPRARRPPTVRRPPHPATLP